MKRVFLLAMPLSACAAVVNFLSATFGDHMVLQRAPQQAMLFGGTAPGAAVTTTFNGQEFTTTADAGGTWRQKLPAMPASKTAYTLTFSSTAGETASISDVLFGDVFICSGQSNMQFALTTNINRTEEIALADQYPTIRLFTVGQGNESDIPFDDLQTVEQPWSVASSKSIDGKGPTASGWGYFSAVCWFFGRHISEALSPTGDVPIGLVSSNWGGTMVEMWTTPAALETCGRTGLPKAGLKYNAMLHPYTVGPMAISGFAWYQGESNTRPQKSVADQYACDFQAMISEWRKKFQNPDAFFGFVQLSTWCSDDIFEIPQMREAQMTALALPNVGYATNTDHGLGCTIHPKTKQFCGKRLGDSALGLHYGQDVHWRSPSYASTGTPVVKDKVVSVVISLVDVSDSGLTTDVYPANYVDGLDCTNNLNCTWAGIEVDGVGWLNATVKARPDKRLALKAVLPSATITAADILATSYGWGPIPMMNAYDSGTSLPVLPWKRNVTETAANVFV